MARDANSKKLIVYDDTCIGPSGFGLTTTWRLGSRYYKARGMDAARGVRSWREALEWLSGFDSIDEIQFWGHGKWGCALIDKDRLDESALDSGHTLYPLLTQVRERLNSKSLFWFRTCETYGAHRGHSFAKEWTNFLGCRTAGHTHIIGPWQSGLQVLEPGESPTWSPWDGLKQGSPDKPERAAWSGPTVPNTITCLHTRLPGYARSKLA